MTVQTEWLEIGEPASNDRVTVRIRTTYETGPQEQPRNDDVELGTIRSDALELIETNDELQRHIQEDGSVHLGAVSDNVREELLDTFEPSDTTDDDNGNQ
ncbi:hypothetical protein [Halorubrum halodurans]|uniref:hypothetical protein n=1 Tax=Halorubrum halodurans TaxID=1383851 RepID=UPI00117A19E7|nr:hypothetical protein [Halorubrum halodurans]